MLFAFKRLSNNCQYPSQNLPEMLETETGKVFNIRTVCGFCFTELLKVSSAK